MSQKSSSAIAVIGIDIGKNVFHLVGQDRRGAIVLRQKWTRSQVEGATRGLAAWDAERQGRATASLDGPLRAARLHAQAGTKERPPGTNKGTSHEMRSHR